MKFISAIALAAVALVALPAVAQVNIAQGKAVTGTAYYSQGSEVFPLANITDGRLGDTGSPSDWSFWLTPNGQAGTAVIDLGSSYNLSSIYVQNTLNRGYQDREAATVYFYLSSAAPTLGNTATYGSLLNGVDFTNTTATVYGGDGSGMITDTTFATTAAGRYLTVDLTSYYGLSGGLNEVEVFGAPSAVPEPATWAMMLVGFGMVGFGLRYRRKSATARVSLA